MAATEEVFMGQAREFEEKVIQVNRVSKKTKGGNKIGFSVLIVVGDKKGRVGVGLGKAADVASAMRKASSYAQKHLITVATRGTTIPHEVRLKLGAAQIMLKPAPAGSGVIAGGPVRAVVEAAGIRDILSKSRGSANMLNVAMATLRGLTDLKDLYEVAKMRGKKPSEIAPFWLRKGMRESENG